MCGMMNLIQLRRAREASSREELEAYLAACADLDRPGHYAVPETQPPTPDGEWLTWPTPVTGPHERNNTARALWWPCASRKAPTVLILHALMSASDLGYRRIARWFHARGWNVAMPHLPYHYSRVPPGTFNGELAITSHLVRNAENLRQAVIECRQLLRWLRKTGNGPCGVLGTSFGGWVGALLSSVEPELQFLALVQPISDTETAIFDNPASRTLAAQVRKAGITRAHIRAHAHLSSPNAASPASQTTHIVLTSGKYDTIARPADIAKLARAWHHTPILEVTQGHFGYAAMPATLHELEARGALTSAAAADSTQSVCPNPPASIPQQCQSHPERL
jgi:pimeloyl-ACP methyl ester carboxylesterase